MSHRALRMVVGVAAVASSALYIVSDLLELAFGGFSRGQLWVTYVAFLAIPFVVIGLHAVQAPRAGWLSLAGALGYGASFVFFAGTVVYALARGTSDYGAMVGELGAMYKAHGVLMIVGGLLFGVGVARARVLPRWTGMLLAVGAILNLVIGILSLPELSAVGASMLRNVAFIGMGIAVMDPAARAGPPA